MKLLICTQKVDQNDSVLGFFHRWIEEFAKHCEKVTVICLERGECHLPGNVRVLSLGKEKAVNRMKYILLLYGYIWKFSKDYDTVFVHMNSEYVVLGGWLWRLIGKKIKFWYVHRQVNFKLRVAATFAHEIFSVSKESFRLENKKVRFVGHGIDTEFFKCEIEKNRSEIFKIISVGRITRIKNLDTLIKAADLVRKKFQKKFVVELIGEPVTRDDHICKRELEELIKSMALEDIVKFSGSKLYSELPHLYCKSELLINLAPTGGLDKVVLEAMSCGLPVLVSNYSFSQFLDNYREQLLFRDNDVEDLVKKIVQLLHNPDLKLISYLREQVVENHNLQNLVKSVTTRIKILNK